jgi:hypothetical protein
VPLFDFFDRIRDWVKQLGKTVEKATEDPSGLGYHHWTGTYKSPNYDGHEEGALPKEIKCGQSFVIYIAEPSWEDSCAGFGGVDDGNNPNCVAALNTANAAAAQVTCESGCPRRSPRSGAAGSAARIPATSGTGRSARSSSRSPARSASDCAELG